jgi:flagellar motor switch protein FliN/FliY
MSTEQAESDALLTETDAELQRILHLRVPVIVQLATRRMPIGAVRDLSAGAIVEFDKSVDDALDLLVNNRLIGRGHCVKVGENFGLQITRICDPAERVRSLGK